MRHDRRWPGATQRRALRGGLWVVLLLSLAGCGEDDGLGGPPIPEGGGGTGIGGSGATAGSSATAGSGGAGAGTVAGGAGGVGGAIGTGGYVGNAQRLLLEDCEDTSFAEHFLERSYGTNYQEYWTQSFLPMVERSDLAPHGGSYSATWNPWVDANFHGSLGLGNVPYGNTSDFDIAQALGGAPRLYFRWWMRWQENIDYSGSTEHKLLYINWNSIGDFVLTVKKNGPDNFHLSGRSQTPYELRENHWLTYAGGSLDDMEWHEIEVFLDWTGVDATGTLWIRIDDVELFHSTSWFYRDEDESTDDVEHFVLPSNISGTPSGNAQEWWDDVEVWDDDPTAQE